MEDDTDPPLPRHVAIRLREAAREARHGVNARHGLTCFGREGHDRVWGLWRDEGDRNLVPWTELGPHGIIWAIWVNPRDPEDMVLAVEHRDDDADPPEAFVRLLRLPEGRWAERPCAADLPRGVERVYLADDAGVLLRWFPYEGAPARGIGFGLLDLDLAERMPPVARHTPEPVRGRPALVKYQHRQGRADGAWGVFDIKAGRDAIPPVYQDLDLDGDRWIANRPDGGCDILSAQGEPLRELGHSLHRGLAFGEWNAEKDGLWGRARADGSLDQALSHPSVDALQRAPVALGALALPAAGEPCAVLPRRLVQGLREDLARDLGCYKYEGLADIAPDGSDDGYADLSYALLPDGSDALLLALRHAPERWLVLEQGWQDLPAGSLLRLGARPPAGATPVSACVPNGADEDFVAAILAQR